VPRIAVDAMGGDRAPHEIVQGAGLAAGRGIEVILVGHTERLKPIVRDLDADLPVVHASEVIEMADDPAAAIREKKDSSIAVAARLVRNGDADGMVSAGSTGGVMAAAAFIIGRLPGIARPAIASVFPTGHIVIDAGANLECRPHHLVQFAVMGAAVATVYHSRMNPRVGLLNIGEEDGKGRDLEKDAFALLAAAPAVNFVGNVEGRDLANDTADVFVTDGFTGNVLLKTSEGVGRALYRMILTALSTEEYQESLTTLAPVFFDLRHRLDPESVGGAHLVGTKGVVVISHGSSTRVAIDNAVGMAADGVEKGLIARISEGIATLASAVAP
jgi:glycerol-3-phosphate acyltransferase PlsX